MGVHRSEQINLLEIPDCRTPTAKAGALELIYTYADYKI
jgi:hypothetical protein